jgi:hypothetical protein
VWGSQDDPSSVRVRPQKAGAVARAAIACHRKLTSRTKGAAQLNDNGAHVIPITRNLDIALRHLRYLSAPRLIWIDALCIDQTNNAEKSSQVAIMGKIFSSASRVIIWLGPAQDHSNEALALLKNVSKEVEFDLINESFKPSAHSTSRDWADIAIDVPFVNGGLNPVAALFGRPYFRRVWIRQEVALAKEAVVYCGTQNIPWDDFRSAAACLIIKSNYSSAIDDELWPTFRESRRLVYDICISFEGRYNLHGLRLDLRGAECHDDRDRINALLSLLSTQERLLNIEPNYDLPVENMYTDVAQRVLVKQQSLAFLESCHPASNALHLPSWVPDWSFNFPMNRCNNMWSACGWISAQARIENGRMYAGGTAKAQVEIVTTWKIDKEQNEYEVAICILRQIKSEHGMADMRNKDRQEILRKCSLAFTNCYTDYFDILPESMMHALALVWSSNAGVEELTKQSDKKLGLSFWHGFLRYCYQNFCGRSFWSAGSYFGLGPADMQEGDVLCVFLGCRVPIVIRPEPCTSTKPLWQIVGPAIVPGLMHGEAIYGEKLPSSYVPIDVKDHDDLEVNLIDGFDFALHDTANEKIVFDPAAILEEVGIKVERYQRYPHHLEVLPETLQAAGVAWEEFALI